jgi:hypothetical protein
MYLSPAKLVLLRIYNTTLGRSAFFSKTLKKALIKGLVKRGKYCASSRFFDVKELEDGK